MKLYHGYTGTTRTTTAAVGYVCVFFTRKGYTVDTVVHPVNITPPLHDGYVCGFRAHDYFESSC